MLQRLIGKGVRALQRKRVQRKLKPKDSNKKTVKKDTARVQAEAQAGAKRADRGTKTKQVAKRVLPEMSKVRGQELRFKTNKSGGTVKRKAGGRIGMGAALRGGGAVRKK